MWKYKISTIYFRMGIWQALTTQTLKLISQVWNLEYWIPLPLDLHTLSVISTSGIIPWQLLICNFGLHAGDLKLFFKVMIMYVFVEGEKNFFTKSRLLYIWGCYFEIWGPLRVPCGLIWGFVWLGGCWGSIRDLVSTKLGVHCHLGMYWAFFIFSLQLAFKVLKSKIHAISCSGLANDSVLTF